MNASTTRDSFRKLIEEFVNYIGARPLDATLEADLNHQFPASGQTFAQLINTCNAAIAEGWMCERSAGGIRYGRVYKPETELKGYSVDVVDMDDVKGPHHRHPNGEIDVIMPLTNDAQFDGHTAGWLVYGPDSAHFPTVHGGRALILYLLPQGAIEFTR